MSSVSRSSYLVVVGLAVGQALPLVVTVAVERLLALAGAASVLVLGDDNLPWRRRSAQHASASQGPSLLAPLSVAWERSKSKRYSSGAELNEEAVLAPAGATDGNTHLVVAAEAVELVQLVGCVARPRLHLEIRRNSLLFYDQGNSMD